MKNQGEYKEIHVWLWCLRGALNVCDSEMPSGCRGPLVPEGRKEFDVKWLVHLYLLTACIVPFSIQERKKETGSQETFSQDGYV